MNKKIYKIVIGLFVILIMFELIKLLQYKNTTTKTINSSGLNYKSLKLNYDKYPEARYANVKVIDLDAELEPKDLYENITCTKSKQIIVSTTLCIYDVISDMWISSMIILDGAMEKNLTGICLKYTKKNRS